MAQATTTGCSVKQMMTMLSDALIRENNKWMPCTFPTTTSTNENKVIDAKERSVIIEWLMSLNDEYCFYPETLFLSVRILDSFLNLVKAHPKYLKCIAVTCFYLAAKATEEDELIPSTSDLVRESRCGCSVSEVLRMERCVLDKFSWDLRMTTPLEFLHVYHGLVVSSCPDVFGFACLSPSRHLHRLTKMLRQCLLHHQLLTFAPSTVALAVLSLDLESFFPFWMSATVTIQSIAQIRQSDLISCRGLVVQRLNCEVGFLSSLRRPMSLRSVATSAKRKVDEEDDIYDGIKRLYGEDSTSEAPTLAAAAAMVVMTTCGSEVVRASLSKSLSKPTTVAG